MPYVGKNPADIIATAVDTTTGTFSGDLTVDTNTLYVDSANNRVGVGTTSPTVLLDLESTSPTIKFTDSDASGTPECEVSGAGGDLTLRADKDDEKASSIIGFEVDGSEAMRIDSSGNFLVGTTDNQLFDNTSGSGLCYRPSLSLDIARESTSSTNTLILLNNTGVDSRYITFRKDATDVGTIGVLTDRIYLAGANEGVAIDDDLNAFIPTEETGGARNNASDLGANGAFWRNIYLGGGIYFGTATDAHKLDDYEEGTWTPQIFSNTTQISVTSVSGFYTVIGNQVYVYGGASRNDTASLTGSVFIKNLPFTSDSSNRNYSLTGGVWFDKSSATDIVGLSWVANNSAQINVKSMNGTGGDTYVSADNFENGRPVYFSATYRIA